MPLTRMRLSQKNSDNSNNTVGAITTITAVITKRGGEQWNGKTSRTRNSGEETTRSGIAG